MSEFPKAYPNLPAFVNASSVLPSPRMAEFGITVNPVEVETVMSLMTPKWIRDQEAHEREIISTNAYPTFDSLLRARNLIRDLRLVPAKSESSQADAKNMPRDIFLDIIKTHYLSDSPISLVKELFPSDISEDTSQQVIWILDNSIPDFPIARFVAQTLKLRKLSTDDVILFERSNRTTTPFVKTAIPEYRHIHMWTRNKSQSV